MKKLIQIFLGILIAACSSGVHAQCSPSGQIGIQVFAPTPPAINPGNSQPGTVLFSTVVNNSTAGITSIIACGQLTVSYTGTLGPYNTESTAIPGIGARFSWSGGPYGLGTGYLPQTTTSAPYGSAGSPANFKWSTGTITLELVQTGPLQPGNYSLGTNSIKLTSGQSSTFAQMSVLASGTTTALPIVVVQHPTCRVSTPSIQVPLGSVPLKSFSGVGSTSPVQPSFNISLSCTGGDTGVMTSVYTTLTDQTNPTNQSNTLSLSTSSTASGIGIQVLNGNTVISYGPDSSVVGNPNQWLAGSTGNGTFNIPLTARYVQTAPTVKPGTANGIATFTMSYQ
ncbi:fimbrial protein [Paraburkholderia panacisoli]|uniref:Fimbrial protein n=1 Tax=Paraburkholderia panacisoli TaxID=2603818 RepID=A0A5B0HA50_9BURK|nr:fimbrial protein [Paraburkholderia panacisoli]KAA1012041.1 fimbrial protein [Paraburkholderia panacisoli]